MDKKYIEQAKKWVASDDYQTLRDQHGTDIVFLACILRLQDQQRKPAAQQPPEERPFVPPSGLPALAAQETAKALAS